MIEIDNDFKPRCLDCFRPTEACYCEHIESLATKTRFIVLMHPMEFKKQRTGTGRMTSQILKNSEVLVDIDFTNNKKLNLILNDPEIDCFILYPGETAINITEKKLPATQKMRVVLVIDGTWPCAKKMMKLSTNLHSLPRVSFSTDRISKFVIKQQPQSYCLSTLESVHELISQLAQSKVENLTDKQLEGMLKPFNFMVDYQLSCARDPNRTGYRKRAYKQPSERKVSKKHNERTIIYHGH